MNKKGNLSDGWALSIFIENTFLHCVKESFDTSKCCFLNFS